MTNVRDRRWAACHGKQSEKGQRMEEESEKEEETADSEREPIQQPKKKIV